MSKLSEYLLLIIIALALIAGGFIAGYRTEYRFALADKAAAEKALAIAQEKLAQQTDKVVTKYVDRVRVIHDRSQAITREVKVYVPKTVDYVVPLGFVRLLNSAAAGIVPQTPDPSDASPSGVALDTVAAISAANYEICQQTSAQLTSLQGWARNVSRSSR